MTLNIDKNFKQLKKHFEKNDEINFHKIIDNITINYNRDVIVLLKIQFYKMCRNDLILASNFIELLEKYIKKNIGKESAKIISESIIEINRIIKYIEIGNDFYNSKKIIFKSIKMLPHRYRNFLYQECCAYTYNIFNRSENIDYDVILDELNLLFYDFNITRIRKIKLLPCEKYILKKFCTGKFKKINELNTFIVFYEATITKLSLGFVDIKCSEDNNEIFYDNCFTKEGSNGLIYELRKLDVEKLNNGKIYDTRMRYMKKELSLFTEDYIESEFKLDEIFEFWFIISGKINLNSHEWILLDLDYIFRDTTINVEKAKKIINTFFINNSVNNKILSNYPIIYERNNYYIQSVFKNLSYEFIAGLYSNNIRRKNISKNYYEIEVRSDIEKYKKNIFKNDERFKAYSNPVKFTINNTSMEMDFVFLFDNVLFIGEVKHTNRMFYNKSIFNKKEYIINGCIRINFIKKMIEKNSKEFKKKLLDISGICEFDKVIPIVVTNDDLMSNVNLIDGVYCTTREDIYRFFSSPLYLISNVTTKNKNIDYNIVLKNLWDYKYKPSVNDFKKYITGTMDGYLYEKSLTKEYGELDIGRLTLKCKYFNIKPDYQTNQEIICEKYSKIITEYLKRFYFLTNDDIKFFKTNLAVDKYFKIRDITFYNELGFTFVNTKDKHFN